MLDVLTAICLHFVNPMMHCTLPVKELSKPYLSPDPVSGSTVSIYGIQFLELQGFPNPPCWKVFNPGHHFKSLSPECEH